MSKKKSLQVYLDDYDRAILESIAGVWGCSLSSAIKRMLRERPEAANILYKGLNILGVEWNKNSTSGHEGSGSEERKAGEKIASTVEKQFNAASELR